jgi:hypothetical protein
MTDYVISEERLRRELSQIQEKLQSDFTTKLRDLYSDFIVGLENTVRGLNEEIQTISEEKRKINLSFVVDNFELFNCKFAELDVQSQFPNLKDSIGNLLTVDLDQLFIALQEKLSKVPEKEKPLSDKALSTKTTKTTKTEAMTDSQDKKQPAKKKDPNLISKLTNIIFKPKQDAPVQAHLDEDSEAYYDPIKKKWCFKGEENNEEEEDNKAPPKLGEINAKVNKDNSDSNQDKSIKSLMKPPDLLMRRKGNQKVTQAARKIINIGFNSSLNDNQKPLPAPFILKTPEFDLKNLFDINIIVSAAKEVVAVQKTSAICEKPVETIVELIREVDHTNYVHRQEVEKTQKKFENKCDLLQKKISELSQLIIELVSTQSSSSSPFQCDNIQNNDPKLLQQLVFKIFSTQTPIKSEINNENDSEFRKVYENIVDGDCNDLCNAINELFSYSRALGDNKNAIESLETIEMYPQSNQTVLSQLLKNQMILLRNQYCCMLNQLTEAWASERRYYHSNTKGLISKYNEKILQLINVVNDRDQIIKALNDDLDSFATREVDYNNSIAELVTSIDQNNSEWVRQTEKLALGYSHAVQELQVYKNITIQADLVIVDS